MTHSNQSMSPSDSPGQPENANRGVRRINNRALFIGIGLVVFFAVVIGLGAYDRSRANQNSSLAEGGVSKKIVHSALSYAESVTNTPINGIIPANHPHHSTPSPATAPRPPIGVKTTNHQLTRSPKEGNSLLSEQKRQIQMMKLQQFQQALSANTAVAVTASRDYQTGGGGQNNTSMDKVNTQTQNSSGAAHSGAGYGGFGDSAGHDRWRLDSKPQAPRTPYEVRAGFVIPAVMITGVNSDLPGQIVAQVSQNVYDTPTGRYLLVPQGARLVGTYASDVAFGQSRVLVGWQRIIFPDGKAMDIGSMPGSNSAGYSGFKDQVNNHYLRIFGGAIMMSAITAGVTLSQQDRRNFNNNNNGISTSDAINEALGQQLGQVAAQLISKNMNISPTLEIRPGYRFNVTLTKDLTFKTPYRSFDYPAGGHS